MSYSNGADGITYLAYDCAVATPGSEITCRADEGVGALHYWTVTVDAPGTSSWTATSTATTTYRAPTLTTDYEATTTLATEGGTAATLAGSNFGPRCDTYCNAGEMACGASCVAWGAFCATAPSEGHACQAALASKARGRQPIERECSQPIVWSK